MACNRSQSLLRLSSDPVHWCQPVNLTVLVTRLLGIEGGSSQSQGAKTRKMGSKVRRGLVIEHKASQASTGGDGRNYQLIVAIVKALGIGS